MSFAALHVTIIRYTGKRIENPTGKSPKSIDNPYQHYVIDEFMTTVAVYISIFNCEASTNKDTKQHLLVADSLKVI